jgi:hypothetical protein
MQITHPTSARLIELSIVGLDKEWETESSHGFQGIKLARAVWLIVASKITVARPVHPDVVFIPHQAEMCKEWR